MEDSTLFYGKICDIHHRDPCNKYSYPLTKRRPSFTSKKLQQLWWLFLSEHEGFSQTLHNTIMPLQIKQTNEVCNLDI